MKEETKDAKRCFVALDLPREAINYIGKIQNLVKKRNLFNGSFTDSENLHLTLKFLGDIQEEEIEKVKERLRKIKFLEFEAEFGEIGVFSKQFIKIIWVGLKGVGKFQKEVDGKLKDLFDSEYRFMGHITIARVKNVGDKKALLEYIEGMKVKKINFKVDKFFLKESEFFSGGPIYSDLEEYNLEKLNK